MTRTEILEQVQEVFRDVFDNEELVISESSSANDIDEWDSLTNIQLIVGIEHQFNIKFDSEELSSWGNVGEMISSIEEKL